MATVGDSSIQVVGGQGAHSYFKNSHYQLPANVAKQKIEEAIMKKLDVESLCSNSNTIRLADFGCAVGQNTFSAMQDLLGIVKKKFKSQCPASQELPQFQVFFNDKPNNDFNTLFASLPPERVYFVAGVPGLFHQQVFPESSLHLVLCSYSLHWLSKLPEELQDKNSPAFNKGYIHYAGAPPEVLSAYSTGFAKDLDDFLNARAKEIVQGGIMVIITPSIPDGMPYSQVANGLMYKCMQSILMDMVIEGLVSEDLVDTFNLPIYACPPGELAAGVERHGLFAIEVMGLTNPAPWLKGSIDMPVFVKHVRAAMEGMFNSQFAGEVTDEMFKRLVPKLEEISEQMEACYRDGLQLFSVLQRK